MAATPDQPNVLVILSDQLRRHALSCYGDVNLQTPHLDALASDGVRFENACSTYPICVPFRFTFMTGHYCHSRQVPGIDWRMSPAERTLADEFNDAGYESIYVGKWHLYGGLGPALMKKPIPREHRGRWSKWLGFEFRNAFFDSVYFEDDDPTPIPIDGYQTDGLFDAAIDYLGRRERAAPFAMVLSVEAPHPPMEAPKRLEEKWLARGIELPPNFMHESQYSDDATGWSRVLDHDHRDEVIRRRKIYYAMVENLDDNVGRMMHHLRDSGQAENTIVMFVSDHGELGGAHRLEGKQYPHEESIGIPLIVAAAGRDLGRAAAAAPEGETPGGLPRGKTIDDPVATEDLFPTILGLAGISPRETLHGTDLNPLMRGEVDALARDGVMLEFVQETRAGVAFHKNTWRGFRSRRYKYTVLGGHKESNGLQPWQFFDLENDPHEMNNRVDDPACRELIAQHHASLRQRMIETGDHAWLGAAFGQDDLNRWDECFIGG